MTVPVGPDLELQGAIVAALTDSIVLQSLIGNPPRINPPQSKTWPGSYIQVGLGDSHDASNSCGNALEIYPTIHIWSRKDNNFVDAKQIAAAIWVALHNAQLSMSENRFFSLLFDHAVPMQDPDGTTLHIAATYKARIETA